jgi:hypothetical protein
VQAGPRNGEESGAGRGEEEWAFGPKERESFLNYFSFSFISKLFSNIFKS